MLQKWLYGYQPWVRADSGFGTDFRPKPTDVQP